jgi:hypothetical protein
MSYCQVSRPDDNPARPRSAPRLKRLDLGQEQTCNKTLTSIQEKIRQDWVSLFRSRLGRPATADQYQSTRPLEMASSKHHSRDKLKHLGEKVTMHFSLSPSTLSNPGSRFYSGITTKLSAFLYITPSQHHQLPSTAKLSRFATKAHLSRLTSLQANTTNSPSTAKFSRFATKAHLSRLMPILLNSNSPPRKHHACWCSGFRHFRQRAVPPTVSADDFRGLGAFRILTGLHEAALAALAENAMCNKSEIERCGAWLGRFKFCRFVGRGIDTSVLSLGSPT